MFVVLLMLPGVLAHAASSSPGETWRWPLRGPVASSFRLTPGAPYARGQRRGIDIRAAPGTRVLAACPGRATFAGALPRFGLAVSVRCGALVATYLRLGRVEVRRGASVAVGRSLGTLGSAGALRLGARRASDRRGYVDPLLLLRDPSPRAPHAAPTPRPRHPRAPVAARPAQPRVAPLAAPPPAPAPLPHVAPGGLPLPAYPALALIASALPLGGLAHRRRRRHARSLASVAERAG